MASLRKVVNSTMISLTGQVITWISTLLLTIAYGRFLGDFKFGELYFAITFVQLIGFPIEFGFNQQITRDVAQEPAKALSYLSNTLLIKGILWLTLYSLILVLCWLLGYSAEERALVAICGITLLSTSITTTFASIQFSLQRLVYPVIGGILEKGIAALIGIVLLRFGAGVQVMAYVLLLCSIIDMIWQASWLFHLVGHSFIFDRSLMWRLVRTSIPFLVYGILGVIYYRVDTIMLSLMTNTVVVGWYGAGYRLFDTLLFLPGIVINTIMYPVFSKLSLSSESSLKLAIEKTTNFLLFCSVPLATILIVAAPNIIGFLYHRAEFSHTIPVLQALAPGLVFLYINSVLGSIIMSIKHERKISIMAIVALGFNLSLNLLLIPHYQQVGTAIVTSLTELLLLFLSVIFVPKSLLPVRSLRVGIKIIFASLVMAVVAWLLRTFSIFVLLTVSALVYAGVATLIRTIPRADIEAIYQAVKSKRRKTEPETPEFQGELVIAEKDTEPELVAINAIPDDDEDTVLMTAIPWYLTRQLPLTPPNRLDQQETSDAGEIVSQHSRKSTGV